MKRRLLESPFILVFAHKLVAFQNSLTVKLVLAGYRKHLNTLSLIRLGTTYGGWFVPRKVVKANQNSVVVSAGLGHDTSFDLEMIKNGWYLIGLDPLLECCDLATRDLARHGNFEILNFGLASWSGNQIFYAPKVSGHDSYSAINVQQVSNPVSVSFPVISLEDLFKRNTKLRGAEFKILKMDIEGAELDILKTSMDYVNHFDFLAVEMDFLSLTPFLSIFTRLKRIQAARKILAELEGDSLWRLVRTENFNFFWSKW
jgi:FkbM family methyltransferase